jgi:hypothetical protein
MRASSDTGVDAKLLHAVISVESGYNQGAVSPKGATGLMQLLPSTARRYGTVNLLDPADNIRAGARYLRDLLAMFDNNIELALAAYNAGENAVIRHGRRLPLCRNPALRATGGRPLSAHGWPVSPPFPVAAHCCGQPEFLAKNQKFKRAVTLTILALKSKLSRVDRRVSR